MRCILLKSNVAYEFGIYTPKEKSNSQMWLLSINQYTGEIENGAFDISTSFLLAFSFSLFILGWVDLAFS
ncbi:hypothetical protein [Ferruginibacter sp.]|nr:hypothetical protein [Ferruginibacter sp.]